jgi:uncharacterized SAM-dependent methyltransferase
MLDVEVLLTENQLAEQFLAALEGRYLPEKFFYWFPLSVHAWLELCRDTQPYKNYARSYGLISQHAKEIARELSDEPIELVSLGAGQGDKDLLLLEALRARGASARYRPVDSSQSLLEIALARAAQAGFPARGFKADLDAPETLLKLSESARESRLYLLLGNTVGAFEPLEFLAPFGRMLRPQDRLVGDAEIFAAEQTMAGYDNPVNRRFAFAPLASIGLEEGRDGELVFESSADGRQTGLHFVSKHFRASRRLEIPVGGQRVRLEAGEKIEMSRSAKYSRENFLRLLKEVGRLVPRQEWMSDDEQFLLVVAEPGSR